MEIDFAQLREDAGAAAPVLISRIHPNGERDAVVTDVRELCNGFVVIAAATLLLEGRPQPFFLNLCRAAENWRRLLFHLEQRGLRPTPASWSLTPLAGAMLADHWNLAAELAQRTTKQWQQEEEYESEFTWARAVGALALYQEKGTDPGPAIDALARTTDEECWAALALALVRGVADDFAEAFSAALVVHETRTEDLARRFTTRVDRFAAYRYLWIEGLALLRLAQKRGLAHSHPCYRYCPPLAQVAVKERYRGDWVPPIGGSMAGMEEPT